MENGDEKSLLEVMALIPNEMARARIDYFLRLGKDGEDDNGGSLDSEDEPSTGKQTRP